MKGNNRFVGKNATLFLNSGVSHKTSTPINEQMFQNPRKVVTYLSQNLPFPPNGSRTEHDLVYDERKPM